MPESINYYSWRQGLCKTNNRNLRNFVIAEKARNLKKPGFSDFYRLTLANFYRSALYLLDENDVPKKKGNGVGTRERKRKEKGRDSKGKGGRDSWFLRIAKGG